jgi:hypothetical protein
LAATDYETVDAPCTLPTAHDNEDPVSVFLNNSTLDPEDRAGSNSCFISASGFGLAF